ncbi:response regulator [Oscillospiraceae bacterium PP1C4]
MSEKQAGIRIIIADQEEAIRTNLTNILENAHYQVVGTVGDGFDAVALCKNLKPDLVLMDIKMPLLDGLSATKIILEEKLGDIVILMSDSSNKDAVRMATHFGAFGYIIKPVDEKVLIPNIEIAVARSREIKRLENEIKTISKQMEDHSAIEKAKGQLMEKKGMTEPQAYEYIEKLSLSKKIPMNRIAEIILVQNQTIIDF